jgi:hypothetical protein
MHAARRITPFFASIALTALLATACSQLPEYATTLKLSLRPAFADGPTVLDEGDVTVGAYGDLAARGQQSSSLWLSIGNGRSGSEEATFFYWRRQDDVGIWVEELRVSFGGAVYRTEAVEAGGANNIPDDFAVTEYVPEDGRSGIGKITGSLAATPLSDPDGGGQIQVELTALDALVYAASDVDSDAPPVP